MLSTEDIAIGIQDLCRRSPRGHPLAPSKLWTEYLSYLDYVRDLPEAHLRLIRLHSGLICGWPWFKYMGSRERALTSDREKEAIKEISLYRRFTGHIPEAYWISEPINDPKIGILGIEYKNGLINFDIVRYQTTITNLFGAGILEHLKTAPETPRLVEIGAGYGGLAYQMLRTIGPRCNYVAVDFPEMLFFVAHFIRANLPDLPLRIHDPAADRIDEEPGIVLVPHYACDALANGKKTSLMINMLSFQEMRADQVRFYAGLAVTALDGWLYSSNWRRHRLNCELNESVDALLGEKLRMFTRYEEGLVERLSAADNVLFNHLATSPTAPRPCPRPGAKTMWGEAYEIAYE